MILLYNHSSDLITRLKDQDISDLREVNLKDFQVEAYLKSFKFLVLDKDTCNNYLTHNIPTICLTEDVDKFLNIANLFLVNPLSIESALPKIIEFLRYHESRFQDNLNFLSLEIHDLGGTLNQISGYSQLLLASEHLNEEDRGYAEISTNSSNDLDVQIQEFRLKILKTFTS